MISIENEKIFNDANPWVPIYLQDIILNQVYEVLMDEDDIIYLTPTTEEANTVNIPDIATGLIYQIFSYNQMAYIAPIATPSGNIYGTECFINIGNTILMKLNRNNDEFTNVNSVSVHIYDQSFDAFLFIDSTITEIEPNIFKIEFVMPIDGDYLAIIKIGTETYLTKSLKVHQYSYDELNNVINQAKDELDDSKFSMYI